MDEWRNDHALFKIHHLSGQKRAFVKKQYVLDAFTIFSVGRWTFGWMFGYVLLVPHQLLNSHEIVSSAADHHSPACPISNGAALRVLPLGDSITYGYGEASGNSYRRDLECLLYTGGNPTHLIGSIKNGDWQNNDNDGFIYHTIDEIGVTGTPEITGQPKPNVVLLHAGTNDMVQNLDLKDAPARLGNLIDFITSNCPDALVVIAQLIPNANTTVNPRIQTYNTKVPAVVSSRAQAGKRVTMVSMHAVKVSELLDGTHPNEVGYRKMAHSWYRAIVEAGEKGLIVPAGGTFVNEGASSLPPSGRCSSLTNK